MKNAKKREHLEWMLNKIDDRFYLNLLEIFLNHEKYLQKIRRTVKDFGKDMFCYQCAAHKSYWTLVI